MFDHDRFLELAALVALLRRGSGSWYQIGHEVEEEGSASRVLERGDADAQQSLLEREVDLAPIVEEVRAWESDGTRVVTILDADYPDNLRAVFDRPPLIFVRGAVEANDSSAVAIVGSRRADESSLRRATQFATTLGEHGYSIVSGLAEGVDAAAHRQALADGVRTIAVIGTGIRRVYPPAHASLQAEVTRHGAVVSQFWPDQPPTRQSFPMRNAVISGLSLATVVIEASERSGTRIQIRQALAHHRPVFLLRHLLQQGWARDVAQRPGVHVADTPEDVIGALSAAADFDLRVG